MKCFVTGASGHLGQALVRVLVEAGHDVAVLLRPTSARAALADLLPHLTVVEGDLTAVDAVAPDLARFAPDAVFHLAWFGVANRFKDDARQITENLAGSVRLIELAAAAGARTFVGLGSQAEYGRVDGLLTEDLPTRPETTYGVVKAAVGSVGERLAASLGVRFVWVRLLATYGPHDDPQHLIPFVIRELLERRTPDLTPGEQVWDYLYVDDAARALAALAQTDEARGVFNLGSGDGHTVADLVRRLRDLVDPSLPLGLGRKPYPANQVMHLQADVTRLRAVTNWQPRVPLAEGLARTVAWHRARAHDEVSA